MSAVPQRFGSYGDRLQLTFAIRRERGRVLWVAGPASASLGLGELPAASLTWNAIALFAAALLAIPAGIWLEARPARGRACVALAVAAGIAALHEVLARQPSSVVALGALLAVLYLFAFVDPIAEPELTALPGREGAARVGLVTGTAACFAVVVEPQHTLALGGACLASLASIAVALRWGWPGTAPGWSRLSVLVALASGVGLAGAALPDVTAAASVLGGAQLAAAAVLRGADASEASSSILEHPARVLVATFAALCAFGAIVLALPASSESGAGVGFLHAAFTSVSAVCVTGLVVLDTPTAFSTFGEVAILVLIQVGGLGIMTFYTVALAFLGRRVSLREERALAGALNIEERDQLVGSVRRVFLVTGITELVGALALAGSFMGHGDGVGEALWRGLFTAISAFCNAGFALQTDSLIGYQTDPLVLHTVGLLIVFGGLSPLAVVAVPAWIRGARLPVQTSLILWTSAALIVVGAIAYGLMEWTVSLGHLPLIDRVHNAWFQSITLRTAGFNSVDLAVTRPATQAMMIVQMFIGGSPGSTAGGVKTTTAVILLLTVVATLRGQDDATAFGRRIGRRTVYKAAAVVTIGVLAVFGAVIAIQLTQAMDPEVAVFEVVSALGTVGLSIGGTALLDEVGEVIIILCMFAGRVGPLTLFLLLTEHQTAHGARAYPEAEVDVG